MYAKVDVSKVTCLLAQRRHVCLRQGDMSVCSKETCLFAPRRHVRLRQGDMSVCSKVTCLFAPRRHVCLGPCTLEHEAKGLGLGQNTRECYPCLRCGKTGQTSFATSQTRVTYQTLSGGDGVFTCRIQPLTVLQSTCKPPSNGDSTIDSMD